MTPDDTNPTKPRKTWLQALNQPFTGRRAVRTIGLLFVLSVLAVSGRFAWQKYQARPPSVATMQDDIRDYLKKKTGSHKFQPLKLEPVAAGKLADPSASTNETETRQVASSTAPASTNAIAVEEKTEKKEKKPRPEYEQLARQFRKSVKEASDYPAIYRLIGENLAYVDQQFAADSSKKTKQALLLAAEASTAALEKAVDAGLAARIAEAYIWPNIDHASKSDKHDTDAASLLDACEDAFKAAGETENLVRNYRLLIARGEPDKADKFRLRLAKLLEKKQNYAEAIGILREVQNTNDPSFVTRLGSVERMLQQENRGN